MYDRNVNTSSCTGESAIMYNTADTPSQTQPSPKLESSPSSNSSNSSHGVPFFFMQLSHILSDFSFSPASPPSPPASPTSPPRFSVWFQYPQNSSHPLTFRISNRFLFNACWAHTYSTSICLILPRPSLAAMAFAVVLSTQILTFISYPMSCANACNPNPSAAALINA